MSADLPTRSLACLQAAWLRGARSRLLRRADVARRRRVLEIGAGWGDGALELGERAGGLVVALDRRLPGPVPVSDSVLFVRGLAERLPFRDESFDLVCSQLTLLWVADPEAAVRELARVLAPGGCLVALEPDYGGMMEWPPQVALQDVYLAALKRCGAHPEIGRQLPGVIRAAGLSTEIRFFDRLGPPDLRSLEVLSELPLTPAEEERVATARSFWQKQPADVVVHVPFWLIYAHRNAS